MKYVIANLKTSMLVDGVENYITGLEKKLIYPNNVFLAISDLYIDRFCKTNHNILAQNMSHLEGKNLTGMTTVEQLKNIGISGVIIGHSEVRQYLHENNEILFEKIKLALRYNLKVFYCIGETAEQRDMRKTVKVIKEQLQYLTGLDQELFFDLKIVYEPVWAIGTGIIPTKEEIEEIVQVIKGIIISENVEILYGGSVNRNNIMMLNTIEDIAGFLIGSAAYNVDDFVEIANTIINDN